MHMEEDFVLEMNEIVYVYTACQEWFPLYRKTANPPPDKGPSPGCNGTLIGADERIH
jgi:hypothetical protein